MLGGLAARAGYIEECFVSLKQTDLLMYKKLVEGDGPWEVNASPEDLRANGQAVDPVGATLRLSLLMMKDWIDDAAADFDEMTRAPNERLAKAEKTFEFIYGGYSASSAAALPGFCRSPFWGKVRTLS